MDKETAKAIADLSKKINNIQYELDKYINEKTEIIKTYTTQSDKLGYDWKVTKVGELEVLKEYIEQENPVGTSEDNPIIWTDKVPLINNAYYLIDGEIYIWMNEWVKW